MRARVWGCRGTLASPGPDTVRYGGQTSCVEVWLGDGSLVVLDAGTGIRPLGLSLGRDRPRTIHLLITHLHTDHIEGLRFFAPFWDPDVELLVWGPPAPSGDLRRRLAPSFAPPFFPVHLRDVPSHPRFMDTPNEPWTIGSATITAAAIKHPGPTVGYRIQEGDRALAYLPDHEPALASDLASIGTAWISGFGLARGADVLLHDGQYTGEEYEGRVGWGHSTVRHAATFAARAEVARLVLFHHDPFHDDAQLEAMLEEGLAERAASGRPPLELAFEGQTFDL